MKNLKEYKGTNTAKLLVVLLLYIFAKIADGLFGENTEVFIVCSFLLIPLLIYYLATFLSDFLTQNNRDKNSNSIQEGDKND